jgi:nitroreductase
MERLRDRASPGCGGRPGSEPTFVSVPIDRRRFLIVAGGAAAYMALRPHTTWAKKLTREPLALQPWALAEAAPADPLALQRSLIAAAILAPSHWNSQPWRFEVEADAIRLVADVQRALPVTDPDRRWMMASLGAALENMLVATRAYGLNPTVKYFPHGGRGDVVAEVSYVNGDIRRDRTYFAAITERRTNRRNYDGRGLFMENRAKINAQVPDGVRLHWIDDRDSIEAIADLVRDAVRDQTYNEAYQRERFAWMRLSEGQVRARGDGVYIESLDIGGPARWFAGSYFDPGSWFLRFGAESAGKQARAQMRSAGALALLTTAGTGEPEWLKGGQTYERIALRCTQLGISHQPINPPLLEPKSRDELARHFGAGNESPLMLIRMGHAKPPDPTPRRGVALVASFRKL